MENSVHRSGDYAGKGTTALATVGTVLGGLAVAGMNNGGCGNNGILGGLFGGNNNNNCYVNKYELELVNQGATKDAKIAQLEAQVVVDQKLSDVVAFNNNQFTNMYNAIAQNAVTVARNEERFNCLEKQVERLDATVAYHGKEICAQGAINAVTGTKIGCIESQLNSLIKTVIPADNVCSTPLPVTVVK